jgi:hypothetical protein
MFLIQSQRPAAADDLVLIISGVNVSSSSVALIAAKFDFGTLSSSTYYLKPIRDAMNSFGCYMSFSEAFHGFSAFNLPFLSTGTFGSILASKLSTQVKVFAISAGGLARAFKVWKSLIERPLRAASAF